MSLINESDQMMMSMMIGQLWHESMDRRHAFANLQLQPEEN
jgi:hypothetical protein